MPDTLDRSEENTNFDEAVKLASDNNFQDPKIRISRLKKPYPDLSDPGNIVSAREIYFSCFKGI